MSKVRDSVYPTGRSNDWVKKTCAQRETLTIAGVALDGSKWDGLYVGRRKGDDLVYAGKVDPRPENAGVREASCAQGNLGRAEVVRRDRVPRKIRRREIPAPVLPRTAGGPVTPAPSALRRPVASISGFAWN